MFANSIEYRTAFSQTLLEYNTLSVSNCQDGFYRFLKIFSPGGILPENLQKIPLVPEDKGDWVYRLWVLPELQVIQFGVHTVFSSQRIVIALLQDLSIGNNGDFIGIFDGG